MSADPLATAFDAVDLHAAALALLSIGNEGRAEIEPAKTNGAIPHPVVWHRR